MPAPSSSAARWPISTTPLAMPPALLKAYQKLDSAVDIAYELHSGDVKGKKTYKTDAERVAFLFELYQRLASLLPANKAQSKPKRQAKPRQT